MLKGGLERPGHRVEVLLTEDAADHVGIAAAGLAGQVLDNERGRVAGGSAPPMEACTGGANQAFHLEQVDPYVVSAAVAGMGTNGNPPFCFDRGAWHRRGQHCARVAVRF